MAIVALIIGSIVGFVTAGMAWIILGLSFASALGLYLGVGFAVSFGLITFAMARPLTETGVGPTPALSREKHGNQRSASKAQFAGPTFRLVVRPRPRWP